MVHVVVAVLLVLALALLICVLSAKNRSITSETRAREDAEQMRAVSRRSDDEHGPERRRPLL